MPIIRVRQAGGADFATITDAIAAAGTGDTIAILDSATYEEEVVSDVEELTIRGVGLSMPTIEGGEGDVIGVQPYYGNVLNRLRIQNFTYGISGPGAVKEEIYHADISDCEIIDCDYGIDNIGRTIDSSRLTGSSIITRCFIKNAVNYGIHLPYGGAMVTNNVINSVTEGSGIYSPGSNSPSTDAIYYNTIYDALEYGIYAEANEVANNIIHTAAQALMVVSLSENESDVWMTGVAPTFLTSHRNLVPDSITVKIGGVEAELVDGLPEASGEAYVEIQSNGKARVYIHIDDVESHVWAWYDYYVTPYAIYGQNYHHNIIHGYTTGGYSGGTITGIDLDTDPLLTDPASDNFIPTIQSPAIDAAGPPHNVLLDFLGRPRPEGKAADIGAVEQEAVATAGACAAPIQSYKSCEFSDPLAESLGQLSSDLARFKCDNDTASATMADASDEVLASMMDVDLALDNVVELAQVPCSLYNQLGINTAVTTCAEASERLSDYGIFLIARKYLAVGKKGDNGVEGGADVRGLVRAYEVDGLEMVERTLVPNHFTVVPVLVSTVTDACGVDHVTYTESNYTTVAGDDTGKLLVFWKDEVPSPTKAIMAGLKREGLDTPQVMTALGRIVDITGDTKVESFVVSSSVWDELGTAGWTASAKEGLFALKPDYIIEGLIQDKARTFIKVQDIIDSVDTSKEDPSLYLMSCYEFPTTAEASGDCLEDAMAFYGEGVMAIMNGIDMIANTVSSVITTAGNRLQHYMWTINTLEQKAMQALGLDSTTLDGGPVKVSTGMMACLMSGALSDVPVIGDAANAVGGALNKVKDLLGGGAAYAQDKLYRLSQSMNDVSALISDHDYLTAISDFIGNFQQLLCFSDETLRALLGKSIGGVSCLSIRVELPDCVLAAMNLIASMMGLARRIADRLLAKARSLVALFRSIIPTLEFNPQRAVGCNTQGQLAVIRNLGNTFEGS